MSDSQKPQIGVKRRNWLNPRTNERSAVIVISHGPVFVRIPMDEAYDVVNRVHDLCESYEARLSAERNIP